MELKITREAGYVLVRTIGQIDASAEEKFREHLHPLCRERSAKIILDLAESPLINSTGLGQLVMLAANANSSGSRLVLAAVTPFVSIVLSRSKLNNFFETAASVPDAIRLLSD